jgi:hypothetical protein
MAGGGGDDDDDDCEKMRSGDRFHLISVKLWSGEHFSGKCGMQCIMKDT